ncbi:MAG: HAMP domain-containing sensor histidine kinase [Pseudomonadota bacterium]
MTSRDTSRVGGPGGPGGPLVAGAAGDDAEARTTGVPVCVADAGLAGSDGALLLWDTDLEGFSWANAEGLAQWGALGLASLRSSRLDRAMPAMERLRTLTRRALPNDGVLQSLTFWTPRGAQTIACRCLPVDLGDGGHGLLLAWMPRELRARGDVGSQSAVDAEGSVAHVNGANGRMAHLPRLPVAEFQPIEAPDAPRMANGGALQVPGFLNGHAGGVTVTDGHNVLPAPNEDDQFAMDEIARMLVGRRAVGSSSVSETTERKSWPGDTVDTDVPSTDRADHVREAPVSARQSQGAVSSDVASTPQKLDNLHHELRTPLNSIIGFAEMMQREQLGAIGHPRYREYAGDILESARHALGLINDLLDASRVRAGHVEMHCEAFALAAHLTRTLALLEPQISSAGVSVVTGFPQSLGNVWADPRALRQIVSNLITNALKFTRAGGHVFVSARTASTDEAERNAMMIIDIRDTGIGMTDEEIAEALTPWTSGRAELSGDAGIGTGLGLPLVKTLVEAQGGSLELTSAPGEGTCARVWLAPANASITDTQ